MLVSGPVSLPTPHGVARRNVVSAAEMYEAVADEFSRATMLVMCAAVADYRPAVCQPTKVKKQSKGWTLELQPTIDILASLKPQKGNRFVVGFAAETDQVEEFGREKLERKGLDLVVANDVSRPEAGMEADMNAAILLDRFGGRIELPLMNKADLAEAILDRIAELRQRTA